MFSKCRVACKESAGNAIKFLTCWAIAVDCNPFLNPILRSTRQALARQIYPVPVWNYYSYEQNKPEMSLLVLSPGQHDCIVDPGQVAKGPSLEYDAYAASVANMLVGNPRDLPLLQFQFPGPELLFEQTCLISITGAHFSAMLDDKPLPSWHPIVVNRNTVLHFAGRKQGSYGYLAVHGGMYCTSYKEDCPGNGGLVQASLQKTQRIYLGEQDIYAAGWLTQGKQFSSLPWHPACQYWYNMDGELLLEPANVAGVQPDKNFISWLNHPHRWRMIRNGERLYLEGGDGPLSRETFMTSSYMPAGSLLLNKEGRLSILLEGRQVNNEMLLGRIIAAHWSSLVQARAGDSWHIKIVDAGQAAQAEELQNRELLIIERACNDHLHALVET